jgi:hypothetical protein
LRNAKRRNTFLCRFQIPGNEASKHFIHKECQNVEMSKCEKHLLVLVSDTESWSVETLCNRNVEMTKRRNAFSNKAMVIDGGHIVEAL